MINGDKVETVTEYKYLGTIIDNKLSFSQNTDAIYKKCQTRLHFLRKLRSFNVDSTIMSLFYKCCIQSILVFSVQSWFGGLSLKNKNKPKTNFNRGGKHSGCSVESLDSLFNKQILQLANRILDNPDHFLYPCYELLPSGRRYRVPNIKSKRYQMSFIPISVSFLNNC